MSNRTSPRSHCAVVIAPRSQVTSNYPFFTFIPVTSYELLTLGHTASHFLAINYIQKTNCERFELMTQFPLRVGVAREMICLSQRTSIHQSKYGAMKIVAIGAMLALLSGCASGFEKSYHPVPAEKLAQAIPQFAPPPPKPAIYLHSANMQADRKQMADEGYVFIGESSLYGPANKSDRKQAIDQGKKVGAAVVISSPSIWTRGQA